MRITKKLTNNNYINNENKLGDALNKLGQIEDLMEKYNVPDLNYLERCIITHDKYGELYEKCLGILDVVIEALENDFWFINKAGGFVNSGCYMRPLLDLNGKRFLIQEYVDNAGGCWYVDYMYIYFKDYKKTWFLKQDRSE